MRWGASAIVRVAQSMISWVVVRYLATSLASAGFWVGVEGQYEQVHVSRRQSNGPSPFPDFVSGRVELATGRLGKPFLAHQNHDPA